MPYFDTAIIPVPSDAREEYLAHARQAGPLFKQHGALRVIEAWGDDVSPGKRTSFPLSVELQDGETVVCSFVEWPDKETRDAALPKVMDAMRTTMTTAMPFDGSRMIFGGFDAMMEL